MQGLADSCAVPADWQASSSCPCSCRTLPRLLCGRTNFGSSSMARRYRDRDSVRLKPGQRQVDAGKADHALVRLLVRSLRRGLPNLMMNRTMPTASTIRQASARRPSTTSSPPPAPPPPLTHKEEPKKAARLAEKRPPALIKVRMRHTSIDCVHAPRFADCITHHNSLQ